MPAPEQPPLLNPPAANAPAVNGTEGGYRVVMGLLKLSVAGVLLVVGYLLFSPNIVSYMVVAGVVYVFACAVWLSVVAWAYFRGQFEAAESTKMVLFEREDLE